MNDRPVRYRAAWVLPIATPPIRNGALLVDAAGRIAAVGPEAAVPAPRDTLERDLGECALLPGLINVHAHPELTALRGLIADLPFHDWIAALLTIKRAAALSAEDYAVAARWHCVESIAAGMTTIGATEDSGAGFDALRESGQRGIVYREVFGPDPAQADDALAALRGAVDAMRERETDLVRVGVSPHAPYSVSDALFRATAAFARRENLPMAVHAAESEAEQQLVTGGHGPFAERLRARGIATPPRGRSTIALLDALGVLDARPLLIHCVTIDRDDIARMAEHGASVAHCPAANARLGHGTSPVHALRAAGVTVGLGTDSVVSNDRLDLLEEARLAQLYQRASLRDATVLPAAALLRMATLDGARALGIDGRAGSLEAGKDADLCAVSLRGPHTVPLHDPNAAVVHAVRAADVVLVTVRGRVLFDGGPVHGLDDPATRRCIADLGARVAAAAHGVAPAPAS